jgi:hypothetical protein
VSRVPNVLDDYLDNFYLQSSSQVDGLLHMRHPVFGYYNGVADATVESGDGVLGIHRWAERGLAGRAVLLDVGHYLEERGTPIDLRSNQQISVALLDEVAEAQGCAIRPGDMVLIRTGWLQNFVAELTDAERLEVRGKMRCPGLAQEEETVRWIWEHQIPLIAADQGTVESFPPASTSPFLFNGESVGDTSTAGLMHYVLIPLLGVVLGELWVLDELAQDCRNDGVWEMLVVSKPLNVWGAVGSPANALAIR